MCLSVVQVESERREIERFLLKTPKDFRNACIGWDMRRRLEVDFGGSATGFAGESVVVFDCGMAEGMLVAAKRYSRAKTTATPMKMISSAKVGDTSLERLFALFDLDSIHSSETAQSNIPAEDWLVSKVSFASRKVHQITATSMDTSINALRTAFEDITSNHGESSEASSPVEGRCSPTIDANRLGEVPGQRARLLAAGTSTGYIFLWNIRPSINGLHGEQVICPTRIIRTNSPGISSLAMSALYLVHGGSDGLIQAWDPLASSGGPVRTLKSRSTLVRRQRDRSEARPMRSNLRQPLPVTAIRLDPDVMRLRGIAACGPYIRYWNFSSSEASQREGSRQRKAKGYRHESNLSATYGSFPLTRVGMRGYIAAEQVEHERDEADQVKRNRYMQGRYGVGMGTDDEMLAYATMLSKDSFSESSQQQLDAENAGAAVQASSSRDALSLLHGEDQLSGTSFSPVCFIRDLFTICFANSNRISRPPTCLWPGLGLLSPKIKKWIQSTSQNQRTLIYNSSYS